jgi:hypothetical protein
MNKLKFIATVAVFSILASCSKNEVTKKSALENVKLSFASTTAKPVSAPPAMAASEDPNAQVATALITSVNGLTSFNSLFTVPSGAQTSSTPIIATNILGRVETTQKEYLVYTFSDPQYGSIAYQIADDGDKYTFEIMIKTAGSASYLRLLYAEEKKDQSAGKMIFYDTNSTTRAVALFTYSWTRTGDITTLVMTTSSDDNDDSVSISVNSKTNAGEVTVISNGKTESKTTWDAKGNGTWTTYNLDGSVDATGTWTV